MLCGRCYKKILQDEEVQIEGSIVCRLCVLTIQKSKKKEIIACCHTCHWEIYKGDLIHEDSWSINVGFFVFLGLNVIKHKKLVQCQQCYQLWLNEKEKEKKWWKKYKKILLAGTILSLILLIFLLWRGLSYASLFSLIPLLILTTIPTSRFFVTELKRYKFRKRKKE